MLELAGLGRPGNGAREDEAREDLGMTSFPGLPSLIPRSSLVPFPGLPKLHSQVFPSLVPRSSLAPFPGLP